MAEIKFELKTDLAPIQGTVLEANFEECKAALQERMEPYAALVVTEDGVKSAKGDLAEIRKIRGNIDDARKTVKKIYSTPLAAFEGKCRELTGLCDEAIGNLDGQVKAFQAQKQQEKIDSLRAYFDTRVGDMAEYLPWEAVYNERWKNATYRNETATGEIDQAVSKCRDDVASILQMGSPFEATLLDCYRRTHDLGACLRRNNELVQIEEAAQRKRAEQEAKRKSQEAKASVLVQKTYHAPPTEETSPQEDSPKVYVLDLRLWATQEQIGALKTWLSRNGIRVGRVPKRV